MTQRCLIMNPCDYLIHGQHRALIRRGQGGNIAYMTIDAVGEVDPRQARSAFTTALGRSPVTLGRLGFTIAGGRAGWRLPDRPAEKAAALAERAYTFMDLRDDPASESHLAAACESRYAVDWPLSVGPQVSLEHYSLPDRCCRFVLRWPHCLMDAEGAQRFLADIAACGAAAAAAAESPPRSPALSPADEAVDPLRGYSWRERLGLARRGLRLQRRHRNLAVVAPNPGTREPFRGHAAAHVHFDACQVEQIHAAARRAMPPGIGLYTRYLAACVFLALDRVYRGLTLESPAYCLTLPDRVTLVDRRTGEPLRRPLHGNYLVSPVITATREEAADIRRLGETIQRQVMEYREARGDLCQWALLWMASFLRASAQRVLLALPLGFERLSSGFSCYREVDPPLRTFLGAEVLNLYGGGPLPTPPGWNPVFSRYGDRLTLSLSWNRPAIPDEVAHRYLRYMEEECLTPR